MSVCVDDIKSCKLAKSGHFFFSFSQLFQLGSKESHKIKELDLLGI